MSGMKECSWIPQLQEKSRSSTARALVVTEGKHLADCKVTFPGQRGSWLLSALAGQMDKHPRPFCRVQRAFAALCRSAGGWWSGQGVRKWDDLSCHPP